MNPIPDNYIPPEPGLEKEEPEFSPNEEDIPSSSNDRRGTGPDVERSAADDKPRAQQDKGQPQAPDASARDTVRPEDQSDG